MSTLPGPGAHSAPGPDEPRPDPARAADSGGPARAAVLVAVLAGVQFLAVLDSLAIALALPAIGRDLGLSAAGTTWVINATSVALAGGLLVSGRLSDLYGRRRLFLAGLVLLGAGAVLAGAAGSPAVLLAGRALQGLGAAVAYPSALALTSESFPRDPWRSRAFAGAAVGGAAASILGAGFGGIVTGLLGWRWVAWLTLPPLLALLALAAAVLPADGPRRRGRSLDLPGAALATVTVTALVAAVVARDLRLGAVALAAGVLLAGHERRTADPLLPPGLLTVPRMAGGCLGIAASSAVYSSVAVTGGAQLQALGLTPTRAGLALLPVGVGIVACGLVVTRLRRRFGSVALAAAGLAAGSAGLVWLAAAPEHPAYPTRLLPPLLLIGAALAASSTGLKEHTLGAGDDDGRGVAAAAFEGSTHVGGAVAVACFALAATYPAAHLVGAAFGAAGTAAVLILSPRASRSGAG
jgi:MFS family permease